MDGLYAPSQSNLWMYIGWIHGNPKSWKKIWQPRAKPQEARNIDNVEGATHRRWGSATNNLPTSVWHPFTRVKIYVDFLETKRSTGQKACAITKLKQFKQLRDITKSPAFETAFAPVKSAKGLFGGAAHNTMTMFVPEETVVGKRLSPPIFMIT